MPLFIPLNISNSYLVKELNISNSYLVKELNISNSYLVKELNIRDINNKIIKDAFKDTLSFTNPLEFLSRE